MLTKNAYALIFGLMNKGDYVRMTTIDGAAVSASVSGSNYATNTVYGAFDTLHSQTVKGKPSFSGIFFGDGDTSPSVNDYKFSGALVLGLGYETTKVSMNQTEGYTELQATLAVKNSSNESKTVKEIGLFAALQYSGGNDIFLMDRIVLATPITIPAGGTKSITYNLRHTY